MEVGCNLPPLKNEIIQEKKRELQQYQEYKKMKQRMRDEKRIAKIKEKEARSARKSLAEDLDSSP